MGYLKHVQHKPSARAKKTLNYWNSTCMRSCTREESRLKPSLEKSNTSFVPRCMIVNHYEFVCDMFYIQPYGERIGSMKWKWTDGRTDERTNELQQNKFTYSNYTWRRCSLLTSAVITGVQVGEMSKLGWLIGWSIDWAQQSRFHLKTGTESSLRNVVF
jgi:hypothetical protein